MSLPIPPNATPSLKKGLEAINVILEGVSQRAAAVDAADNPMEALEVAQLLREAAGFYERNEIDHGRTCLLRGFEHATQLRRKGMLKLLPESPAKAKQSARIDNLMLAMRICNQPTMEAIAVHHDGHTFLDTFADEW